MIDGHQKMISTVRDSYPHLVSPTVQLIRKRNTQTETKPKFLRDKGYLSLSIMDSKKLKPLKRSDRLALGKTYCIFLNFGNQTKIDK